MSKNGGLVDFGGQEGRDEAGGETPEMEARDREMKVNLVKLPEGSGSSVSVLNSDDIRLHASRSEVGGDYSGVKAP